MSLLWTLMSWIVGDGADWREVRDKLLRRA